MNLKEMTKNKLLLLFIFLILCATTHAEPSPSKNDLDRTIAHLLKYVEQSQCTFIRNGKEHSPSEAVAHMKRKYEHFKKKIKTAEDFIRLTASKSMISGKPYLIKTKEGETVPSKDWFLNALSQYRKE
jgi:hypothetical protein